MTLASYLSEHGLTDGAFAERIGVSDEAVRLWRHGIRKISPKMAKVISKLTGIPRHELRPDIWEPPKPRLKRSPAPELAAD